MAQDIRWLQRFSNYCKALAKLGQAVDIVSWRLELADEIDELLQEGLIQRFEYTRELVWKETIEDRNLTSHNYDDDVASEIYENIVLVYYPLFCRFEERMLCISENETR